jgi:hypothetical protein
VKPTSAETAQLERTERNSAYALLGMQVVGGVIALMPILSLRHMACLDSWLYWFIAFVGFLNCTISLLLLVDSLVPENDTVAGVAPGTRTPELGATSGADTAKKPKNRLRRWRPYRKMEKGLGLTIMCRIAIMVDTLLLGLLVFATGGTYDSLFALQFAAILPIAMLIRDNKKWMAFEAAFFFIMFLLGTLHKYMTAFHGYKWFSTCERERWYFVFFVVFIFFPAIYGIAIESRPPAEPNDKDPKSPATPRDSNPAP